LTFTCYIDDLTFSGTKLTQGFASEVESIIRKHGHIVSAEKTRYYRKGAVREVTGIVLKGDSIFAPNARFRKARALKRAIGQASNQSEKLHLTERLNGLIGEAAYLEPRFLGWAHSVRVNLNKLRLESPKRDH
jgi:hypothetical protein